MNLVLPVAMGGALGAVLRLGLAGLIAQWAGTAFPWAILAINVLGSFVMGLLTEAMALSWSASPELRAFLTVGLLGGFTTFSSFSLDVLLLIRRDELALAALYILGSVALSLLGIIAGLKLMRLVLA